MQGGSGAPSPVRRFALVGLLLVVACHALVEEGVSVPDAGTPSPLGLAESQGEAAVVVKAAKGPHPKPTQAANKKGGAAGQHEVEYAAVLANAALHFCQEKKGGFCKMMHGAWKKYEVAKQSESNVVFVAYMANMQGRFCPGSTKTKQCQVLAGLIKAMPRRKDDENATRVLQYQDALTAYVNSACTKAGTSLATSCALLKSLPPTFSRMASQGCTSPFTDLVSKLRQQYCSGKKRLGWCPALDKLAISVPRVISGCEAIGKQQELKMKARVVADEKRSKLKAKRAKLALETASKLKAKRAKMKEAESKRKKREKEQQQLRAKRAKMKREKEQQQRQEVAAKRDAKQKQSKRHQKHQSKYEKALQQTVDHYCKRRSAFCGMAKDLQARYKSAMAKGNLGKYRSLLDEDQKKSCRTKAEKAKDRCKALALLWKAFQQRHPHSTKTAAARLKPATVNDFKVSLKSLSGFVCKGAGDLTLLCQATRGLKRHFAAAVAQKKMSLFVTYSTRFQNQECTHSRNSLKPKLKRVCSVMDLLRKRLPVL